jgi:hypothetical protein
MFWSLLGTSSSLFSWLFLCWCCPKALLPGVFFTTDFVYRANPSRAQDSIFLSRVFNLSRSVTGVCFSASVSSNSLCSPLACGQPRPRLFGSFVFLANVRLAISPVASSLDFQSPLPGSAQIGAGIPVSIPISCFPRSLAGCSLSKVPCCVCHRFSLQPAQAPICPYRLKSFWFGA